MKDYKIKEVITNTRQSIEHLKNLCQKLDNSVSEMSEKFEIMVELLQEERDAKEEKEEAEEGVLT